MKWFYDIITDIVAFLVSLFIMLLLLGAVVLMLCGITYLVALTVTAIK